MQHLMDYCNNGMKRLGKVCKRKDCDIKAAKYPTVILKFLMRDYISESVLFLKFTSYDFHSKYLVRMLLSNILSSLGTFKHDTLGIYSCQY